MKLNFSESIRESMGNFFSLKLLFWVCFLFLMSGIFLANSLHISYPDEFDNILGGRYIAEGKIIYRDFFTHHGPVGYFVAAFVYLFSGQSFVRFRIFYGLFLFLLIFGQYVFLSKSLNIRNKFSFYLLYIFLSGILATYIWSHLLLADSLSAFLFVPVYLLLFVKALWKKPVTTLDVIFVSISTSLVLLTSLTYTYIVIIADLFCLLQFLKSPNGKTLRKKLAVAGIAITVPYIVFIFYLLLSGSLKDYIFQNFEFNLRYYIYNYPRIEGSMRVNPIRYAISIAYEFFNNYHVLMTRVRDFGFDFPLNVTFALANFSLLIYLTIKRRYSIVLFVIGLMIYSNVRSNPLSFGETDYQSAVYAQLSLLNSILIIYLFKNSLNGSRISYSQRVIFTSLFVILSAYSVASGVFITRKFNEKVYLKYMGKEPLIYDGSLNARVINDLVKPDEYAWIGPFHFEDLLYMNAKIPSRYQILIPGFGKSSVVQQKMIEDFRHNLPSVILFDKRFHILGDAPEQYAQFFLDFLNENYGVLYDYSRDENRYFSGSPVSISFDLETQLYLRKDKIDELAEILVDKGWVKRVKPSEVDLFLMERDKLK